MSSSYTTACMLSNGRAAGARGCHYVPLGAGMGVQVSVTSAAATLTFQAASFALLNRVDRKGTDSLIRTGRRDSYRMTAHRASTLGRPETQKYPAEVAPTSWPNGLQVVAPLTPGKTGRPNERWRLGASPNSFAPFVSTAVCNERNCEVPAAYLDLP